MLVWFEFKRKKSLFSITSRVAKGVLYFVLGHFAFLQFSPRESFFTCSSDSEICLARPREEKCFSLCSALKTYQSVEVWVLQLGSLRVHSVPWGTVLEVTQREIHCPVLKLTSRVW